MISVLMGIYNCAETLPEAINSILNQTYGDWELIMCDDGSGDNTYQVAKSYADKEPRIVLLRNELNLGLNKTLNKCLAISKGEYIARMDGDDICDPTRFEKELAVLNSEPDIAIVSTPMFYFDENGVFGRGRPKEYPQKENFVKGSPICHAPCLVRREAYLAVEGYSELEIHRRAQDYHLWAKMYAKGYRAKNLSEPLYSMRDDRNAYARRTFKSYMKAIPNRFVIFKMLELPLKYYPYILKPLVIAFTPSFIYDKIHKKNLSLWNINENISLE